MARVLDPEAFSARVNYAATCIMAGRTHTRTFDNCFEMSDGDYVVEALMRRAENNQLLSKAISALGCDSWPATHERLKSIPRGQLAAEAANHRQCMKEEYARWIDEQRKAGLLGTGTPATVGESTSSTQLQQAVEQAIVPADAAPAPPQLSLSF